MTGRITDNAELVRRVLFYDADGVTTTVRWCRTSPTRKNRVDWIQVATGEQRATPREFTKPYAALVAPAFAEAIQACLTRGLTAYSVYPSTMPLPVAAPAPYVPRQGRHVTDVYDQATDPTVPAPYNPRTEAYRRPTIIAAMLAPAGTR